MRSSRSQMIWWRSFPSSTMSRKAFTKSFRLIVCSSMAFCKLACWKPQTMDCSGLASCDAAGFFHSRSPSAIRPLLTAMMVPRITMSCVSMSFYAVFHGSRVISSLTLETLTTIKTLESLVPLKSLVALIPLGALGALETFGTTVSLGD